jgi:tyrosine aminotransferase
LADEGDNFLFPSPGFPLASVIANSMGIETKLYHLNPHNHWKADLVEMEELINERTRFILVNDPSNPLGTCWS